MENSRKKFFYLLFFLMADESADCISGVVPSANVNKMETVFKQEAEFCIL